MFDEVMASHAVLYCIVNDMSDGPQLMITREYQTTFGAFDAILRHDPMGLGENKGVEDAQPGLRFAYFLPEVRDRIRIGLRSRRIAGMTFVPLIERQEFRSFALQLRRHLDVGFADGKMKDGTSSCRKKRAGLSLPSPFGVAVLAVLLNRQIDVLSKVCLNFGCGDWNPIDEEYKV